MLPQAIVIPRQHHLARRVLRVQVDVGIQRVARLHQQRVHRSGEVVLMEPGRQRRLVRQRTRVRRRIRTHPVPAARQQRPHRRRIVEPHHIRTVVIGDRQLSRRHRTQARTRRIAQAQLQRLVAFDQNVVDDRHTERAARLAVGKVQCACRGEVVDARRRAHVGRRVVHAEGSAVTACPAHRDHRGTVRLADTVAHVAEFHVHRWRRFVRTGVYPDVVEDPAERSAGRAVGTGMPAKADVLAPQYAEVQARRDIAVALGTECRMVGVWIGRVAVDRSIVGLTTLNQWSDIGPGRTRIGTVLDETAVPVGQFECLPIERILERERVLEVQIRLADNGQRHVDVHLRGCVGADESIAAPEHELTGSGVAEVVQPCRSRAAGNIAEVPLGRTGLEVVEEDVVGRISADTNGSLRVEVRRIGVHFDRIDGSLDVEAIDTGNAVDAHEVLAGLYQRRMKVGIVRAGGEHTSLRLVIDLRDLADSQAVDGIAIERIAVGHQVGGLVVDAAVEVHAAVVAGTVVIIRTRYLVGTAKRGRISHVADDADRTREVFTDQPARGRGIVAGAIAEVDELPPDVGQGFIDSAGLVVIQQL